VAVSRYNLYSAASVSGNIKTGYSTGDAIKTSIESVRKPAAFDESGLDGADVLQKRAGTRRSTSSSWRSSACPGLVGAVRELVAALAVIWSCAVPAVLGDRRAAHAAGRQHLAADRAGVLVGLACKNAILVVEYAKQLHLEGARPSRPQGSSRLRLRPILMTSFAFISGVIR